MTTNRDRIITADERRRIVPYSDMHIWRLEREGKFPRRVRLGPRRIGWSLLEVEAWIEKRKAERSIPVKPVASPAAPASENGGAPVRMRTRPIRAGQ